MTRDPVLRPETPEEAPALHGHRRSGGCAGSGFVADGRFIYRDAPLEYIQHIHLNGLAVGGTPSFVSAREDVGQPLYPALPAPYPAS